MTFFAKGERSMKHLSVLLVLFALVLFARGSTAQTTGLPQWGEGGAGPVPQVLVCVTRGFAKPDTPMQCFQAGGASYTSTLSEVSAYFSLVQVVKGRNEVYYYFDKK
jgi:hypothetical protein